MYDVSGKNHLVVNQYRLVYYDYDINEVCDIILYNVHHMRREKGILYIHFYQNKTEPLMIDEDDVIELYKETIERNRIL